MKEKKNLFKEITLNEGDDDYFHFVPKTTGYNLTLLWLNCKNLMSTHLPTHSSGVAKWLPPSNNSFFLWLFSLLFFIYFITNLLKQQLKSFNLAVLRIFQPFRNFFLN